MNFKYLLVLFALLVGAVNAQGISDYSKTAGNNTALFPEPMPAGDVNDASRQMMADIRTWYEDAEWVNFGQTPTQTTSSSFTLTGDLTTTYQAGRRIRASGGTMGTVYGSITGSSFSSPNTTVSSRFDSGSLNSTLDTVSLGILSPVNPSIDLDLVMKDTGAAGEIPVSNGIGGAVWTTIPPPVGSLMPFAGVSVTAPGWALAAGQSVSRTGVYANLFAVIGTTYGSADGNSFNLPDLRGRVVAGLDNMGGVAAGRISLSTAGISGTILGSAGGDQRMQSHTHVVSDTHRHHIFKSGNSSGSLLTTNDSVASQNAQSLSSDNNLLYGMYPPSTPTATADIGLTDIATVGSITVSSTGAGSSENVQPTMMLNWIIKY